jgi:hypothetical protein
VHLFYEALDGKLLIKALNKGFIIKEKSVHKETKKEQF